MREYDYATNEPSKRGYTLRPDTFAEQCQIQKLLKKTKPEGIISVSKLKTGDIFNVAAALMYNPAIISLDRVREFAGLTPPEK